jgi:hypothetical protein
MDNSHVPEITYQYEHKGRRERKHLYKQMERSVLAILKLGMCLKTVKWNVRDYSLVGTWKVALQNKDILRDIAYLMFICFRYKSFVNKTSEE